jgi:hypothetical protein
LGAIKAAGTAYNTFSNANMVQTMTSELGTMLHNALTNTPNSRNADFSFPSAKTTPSSDGTANQPTINAVVSPEMISDSTVTYAGSQYNGSSSQTFDQPFNPNNIV